MSMTRPFLTMDGAPRDGRVIEAESLDYGRGPSTSVYRARFYCGAWINADEPREELLFLQGWREADPREGLEQLLDSLPIAVLERIVEKPVEPEREAEFIYRGHFIEALEAIHALKRKGLEDRWTAAVEALAKIVRAAQRAPA